MTDGEDAAALTDSGRAEMIIYQLLGEHTSLDRAIGHFTAAVVAASGRASPVTRANLAGALLLRFEIDGRPEDLTGSVRAAQDAIDDMDPDDPALAGALTNQAAALLARYERGGPATDLDRAVVAATDAAGRGSPDPGATSSLVAMTMLTRFERDGDRADVEGAVDAATAAVDATAEDDGERGARLSNQAVALRARFELTASTPDLDAAVRAGAAAVEATAAGRPERAMYVSNLAGSLCVRIERLGSGGRDASRAVELAHQAVDATSATSPHRPARMSLLGLALRLAAEHAGGTTALDDAIDVARSGIAAAGADHPERADHLVNLAIALRLRADRTTDPGARVRDLDEAVDVAQTSTTAGHGRPAAAARELALGHALAARHDLGCDRRDLWRAIAAYRRAASSTTSPALQRLDAAHRWGKLARDHGCIGVALAGFTAAVALLPVAAWHGLDRGSRESALATQATLAADAAETAIAAGHLGRATELVDRARTVLWSQQLRLRGDIGELAAARPELAARLDRVRSLLDRSPGPLRRGAVPDHRRQTLAAEWDDLVAEARRVDGFAHFLEPRPLDELLIAATAGPVVIVNVARHGCHALLLRAGRPVDALVLPDLMRADVLAAAERLRTIDRPDTPPDHRRDVVDGLLDQLWRHVVGPVLARLGPATDTDRIRWCPTGPMTLLPLHAARPHGGSSRSVVGSYTVALEPMLRPRNPEGSRSARVLAVGVQHGRDSATPLPATVREVARVAAARRDGGPVTELVGGAATREALLDALSTHDEVHLAGHVVQDPDHPAAAGFLLTDGLVTIAQFADLHLPHGELAVLPGCGTAVGQTPLLDEAMHVAAALQIVGYRHVVATLWAIPDTVGPLFAAAFHETLEAATGPARIHTALCAAVAALQARHGGHAEIWAPFMHLGG